MRCHFLCSFIDLSFSLAFSQLSRILSWLFNPSHTHYQGLIHQGLEWNVLRVPGWLSPTLQEPVSDHLVVNSSTTFDFALHWFFGREASVNLAGFVVYHPFLLTNYGLIKFFFVVTCHLTSLWTRFEMNYASIFSIWIVVYCHSLQFISDLYFWLFSFLSTFLFFLLYFLSRFIFSAQ